jgi:hypothetical protein
VTEAPHSIAFFDRDRQLYGTARSGATLLFEGSSSTVLDEGPEVEASGDSLRAALPGHFELTLEPLSEEAHLEGSVVRVCRVFGQVGATRVDCLGTASRTERPPAWDELDALRTLTVLVDEHHALLALASRPRGARGHGEESVTAWLLEEEQLVQVEEARISTVYDGDGRQRSAGLELWMPEEDFPRHGSGTAIAGSSLDLEGLQVHAAVFSWNLAGREGVGAYELMVRTQAPAAA